MLGDAAKTLVFQYICLAVSAGTVFVTQAPERRSAIYPSVFLCSPLALCYFSSILI